MTPPRRLCAPGGGGMGPRSRPPCITHQPYPHAHWQASGSWPSGSDPEDYSRSRTHTRTYSPPYLSLNAASARATACDVITASRRSAPGLAPADPGRLPLVAARQCARKYLVLANLISLPSGARVRAPWTLGPLRPCPPPHLPSAQCPLPAFNARLRKHDRSRRMSLSVCDPCTSITTCRPQA